jgi:hypothetical protein
MPPVFWLGLGIAGFVFLVGVISGARSRTGSLASGAAIGAYLGVMLAFPLLAWRPASPGRRRSQA